MFMGVVTFPLADVALNVHSHEVACRELFEEAHF